MEKKVFAVKREQNGTCFGSAEPMEQREPCEFTQTWPSRDRGGRSQRQQARRFSGNGLSRTAMVYKIATIGGVTLSVTQLNKIKELNPRSLERVYDEVVRVGDKANALFALRLILK